MSFFAELKRRNVFRVGVAYAVSTWVLLQITDIVAEILALPEWAPKLILLILIIGFIPALIFAWAFELTPDGVKREKDVDRSQSITPKTGQKLNVTIGALLVIALAYIGYDKLVIDASNDAGQVEQAQVENKEAAVNAELPPETKPQVVADTQKSIVVLPFVNMSNDPDQEFFSDGLSEELLNVLAQIKDLRVISRTSAFAFKGKDMDIPTIAAQLGVSHVLEGSVRKAGNDVRITAQLIEVATDSHLWSDAYNRKLENIFEIQEEISKAIAQELKVTLGTSGKSTKPTDNFEAYQLYLRGRNLYQKRENLAGAVDLLKQAVDLDPNFADGWANLAATAQIASFWDEDNYRQFRAQSLAAINRAISLDPDNGLAHAVLGMHYQHELRWEEALNEINLAIELNPNESNSLLYKGEILVMLGYTKDAIEAMKQAEVVDPVFANVQNWITGAYLVAGDYDLAAQHIKKLNELDVNDGAYAEGDLALVQGNLSRAEPLHRKAAIALSGSDLMTASLYAALNDPAKTESTVKFLMENPDLEGWTGIFGYLAILGATDEAIEYWHSLRDRNRLARSANYLQYIWDFPTAKMSEPSFLQFLEDTGMADYWRKHGNPDFCQVSDDNIECSVP
jgi:TolB-like protein